MGKFRRGHTQAARLTATKVLEIRQRYASGETQGALSRDYQVSVGQIGRIVRGEAWQEYQQPLHGGEEDHQQAIGTIAVESYDEKSSLERLGKLLEEAQKEKDAQTAAEASLDELRNPYY